MSSPTPLSYNQYIKTMAGLAVYQCAATAGVFAFTNDAAAQLQVPQMLNYAELRIQRDLDLLSAQASNSYTLNAGQNVLSVPVADFFVINTLQVTLNANPAPLTPVSREFIQNVYGGQAGASTPRFFAMYGDFFGNSGDTYTNILLGPTPNYSYNVLVTGLQRLPSLYSFASNGIADTSYTYISNYLPDMLLMASMIYISMYQRNFSATAADVEMSMSYEKAYQALRLGAIPEENRRKQMGSGWSGYGTPVSATPTR